MPLAACQSNERAMNMKQTDERAMNTKQHLLSHVPLLILLLAPWSTKSFSPVATISFRTAAASRQSTSLWYEEPKDVAEHQELLRKQIDMENIYNISQEKKYGVLVQGKSETVPSHKIISFEEDDQLQKRIELVLKPRPYSLFVLEKMAQIVDDALPKPPKQKESTKERIVVLGSGWGAAAFLKTIDTDMFDVTVVSPRNYFLFTPLLASSSTGSVEVRSITMPIRSINPNVNYLEATAIDLDPKAQKVACVGVKCDKVTCEINDFDVQYDRLVVTVGAQVSSFGVPGVKEHCFFLKEVDDAREIRKAIVDCFERATLPNLSDQEKRDLLTFAVVGAGPTGVEFCGELRDFVEQDGSKYYPHLLKYVKIKLFSHTNVILKPFDKSLQDAAVERLTQETHVQDPTAMKYIPEHYKMMELRLECGVEEVTEDRLMLENGKSEKFGMCLWAAGNGPHPITLKIIDAIGGIQKSSQDIAGGRIAIDPWLRAFGGGGKIFALGDCTCSSCGVMSRQLPATAQVAGQQAEHLARLFSQGVDMAAYTENGKLLPPIKSRNGGTLAEKIVAFAMSESTFAAPFQFLNQGMLAHLGGQDALAQVQVGEAKGKFKGRLGYGVWQSVYLSKQASWKNGVLVALDWVKSKMFGRDISSIS